MALNFSQVNIMTDRLKSLLVCVLSDAEAILLSESTDNQCSQFSNRIIDVLDIATEQIQHLFGQHRIK